MAVRPKTLDRRAEILQAARAVFAEKGLEAAKISEIVARAGVAQGTFYLYFPSKTSLVEALASEAYGAILDSLKAASVGKATYAERLEAMIRAAFAAGRGFDDVNAILQMGVALVERPADWQRYLEPFDQFLTEFVRQGMAAGELEPSLNPERTARLLFLTVNAAIDECFTFHPEQDPEMFVLETVGFVQRALLKR
ncbi:MAG: TetR family transcriptional regulator [Meiothermus sp.]|nr:TetR family transcriptional regulator [Meiothermus sp.]